MSSKSLSRIGSGIGSGLSGMSSGMRKMGSGIGSGLSGIGSGLSNIGSNIGSGLTGIVAGAGIVAPATHEKETEEMNAALAEEDIDAVMMIARKAPKVRLAGGKSPLWVAASLGRLGDVKALVKLSEVNGADDRGRTPVFMAGQHGHHAVLEALLAAGGDANTSDTCGHTPIYAAAAVGNSAVLKTLVAKGAKINTPDERGRTALWCAAREGDLPIVELLAELKASAAVPDTEYGATPMWIAAREGRTDVVTFLAEAMKADTNVPARDGASPVSAAAAAGHESTLRALIALGARIDTTALLAAAGSGHAACVEALLELAPAPSNGDTPLVNSTAAGSGRTALHHAALQGSAECVNALWEGGADLNAVDSAGDTACNIAVREGNAAVVRLLASCGASVKGGNAAVYAAAAAGHAGIVKILAGLGAEVDTKYDGGTGDLWPPVMIAAYGDHPETLRELQAAGAEVDVVDEAGRTSLSVAATRGNAASVRCLLALGANASISSHQHGATPLHLAARYGHAGVVAALTERKGAVDVDRPMKSSGATALYLAARHNHVAAAQALCEARAGLNVAVKGKPPILIASINGHSNVVRMLADAGADTRCLSGAAAGPAHLQQAGRAASPRHLLPHLPWVPEPAAATKTKKKPKQKPHKVLVDPRGFGSPCDPRGGMTPRGNSTTHGHYASNHGMPVWYLAG